MNPTLEAMNFYTKVLTGMVLLLNIGLLVAIRLALKYAKHVFQSDDSENGLKMWTAAKRTLGVLIVVVVGMNVAAVYANHRVVHASRDLAAELPGPDSEIALNLAP